jgi:hypothetical protein
MFSNKAVARYLKAGLAHMRANLTASRAANPARGRAARKRDVAAAKKTSDQIDKARRMVREGKSE